MILLQRIEARTIAWCPGLSRASRKSITQAIGVIFIPLVKFIATDSSEVARPSEANNLRDLGQLLDFFERTIIVHAIEGIVHHCSGDEKLRCDGVAVGLPVPSREREGNIIDTRIIKKQVCEFVRKSEELSRIGIACIDEDNRCSSIRKNKPSELADLQGAGG